MYHIRQMKAEEMHLAVEWAAKEGWNPGLEDGPCFYQTDSNGFFIGELNGEPIACISAVAYDDTYGFIGFYIVKPEFRGKGYGYQIWQAAMNNLGNRNIGLDGVLAQQANYEKSGFKLAYRNRRYEGKWQGNTSHYLVPLLDIPFEQLMAMDCECHAVPRQRFLRQWISMNNITALAKVLDGNLQGFGVLRSCQKGYKIGPLYANDPSTAKELLLGLVNYTHGDWVYWDVPEINQDAVKMAEELNMQIVFETVRMYTKPQPVVALNKVYGVTTFELG